MRTFYTLCWGVRDARGVAMPHYITPHISRKKALETAKQIHDTLGEDRVIYVLESAKGHAVQADHFYIVRANGGEYVPIRTALEPMPDDALDMAEVVPADEPDDPEDDEPAITRIPTEDERKEQEFAERIARLLKK